MDVEQAIQLLTYSDGSTRINLAPIERMKIADLIKSLSTAKEEAEGKVKDWEEHFDERANKLRDIAMEAAKNHFITNDVTRAFVKAERAEAGAAAMREALTDSNIDFIKHVAWNLINDGLVERGCRLLNIAEVIDAAIGSKEGEHE